MKPNPSAIVDFSEGEGLRLTDLQKRTVDVDPEGKGISLSFLSEIRSGTRTECSPKTMRLIADALGVRVRSIAANPNDVAA